MAGERLYTRIPPASTGNRIRLAHAVFIPYTNLTPGENFILNEYVDFVTSGFEGHIHAVHAVTSTTGFIEVNYPDHETWLGSSPTAGENIRRQSDSTVLAQVGIMSNAQDIYTNINNVVSYENPNYGLVIDEDGAANIRFAEGKPQLDGFGKLRVTGATPLGEYTFAIDSLPLAFATRKTGSGNLTWNSNKRAVVLSTTTASGDEVSHTSHTYHHYFPGSAHLFIGTFALGDVGKSGLTRNWGLFDADNGFMFTQRNGQFGVCIRSNVTGSVVDTVIYQSSFNKDRVDGSGDDRNDSRMDFDVTTDNIYWIDVQWLGAGRVRFGTYYLGQRVILHEYNHGNLYAYPVSATASLPICINQKNTGVTASSSEMSSWCLGVWTENTLDAPSLGKTNLFTFQRTLTGSDPTTYQYVGTLSPKETYASGLKNRSIYWPSDIDVLAYDASGNEAFVEVEIYAEPVMANLTYTTTESLNPSCTVDYDNTGTYYGGGIHVSSTYCKGHVRIDTTSTYKSMTYGAFKNYADEGGTRSSSINAITKANPGQITVTTPYHLLREGQAITISGVGGMTELNGQTAYLKINGANTALLYTNSSLSSALDTSGYTTYTSGGTLSGLFGGRLNFVILAKKLFPTASNVTVHLAVTWKEITQ